MMKENLERNSSYFVDILAFELGKLCLGVGILFHFFQPGGRSFALKSCPQGGDFDEKHYWPGGQPGGGGQ